MQNPRLTGLIILMALLAGCASAPPQVVQVEKPVMIQSPPEYVPIPPQLFAGCLPPPPAGPLNGDLLVHDRQETQFAVCLQAELDAIKALK